MVWNPMIPKPKLKKSSSLKAHHLPEKTMALPMAPMDLQVPGTEAGLEHGLGALEAFAAHHHGLPVGQLEDGLVGLLLLFQKLALVVQGHPTWGNPRWQQVG